VDPYAHLRYWFDSSLKSQNADVVRQGAPDGLPLPSPSLVYYVTGEFSLTGFLQKGVVGVQSIRSVLEKNGLRLESFRKVLDFGCGCGRVMRHWAAVRGPEFCGTDFNPKLIRWCLRSIPFARFSINASAPVLEYPDATFDFIYAISVFTHFTEPLQRGWMKELVRILKPGGFMYITTHGESYLQDLSDDQREMFQRGHLVVVREDFAGKNACAAFHPESYMRDQLAARLKVVDFVPLGAADARQDVFLIQKPA